MSEDPLRGLSEHVFGKTDKGAYEMTKAEFIAEAMKLIEQELNDSKHLSTQVLFGDELDASDWTPAKAVNCLFRYASEGGWDYDDDPKYWDEV